MQTSNLKWIAAGAALAGVGFALYRYLREAEAQIPSEIARKLPLAKDLPTVGDSDANYDIDGVSFDDEGTIVSSDNHKH